MRKFIFAVLLMLAILFVIGQATELEGIVKTLQRGDWRFLLLGLCVEVAWILTVALSYQVILRVLGIEEEIKTLVFIFGASNFANVVAPTAGVSGLAVFVNEARRRNYSPARATIASAVYLLFDYLGFLCVLALGLVVLIRRNNISWPEITASIILVCIAMVLAFLMFLGMRSEQALAQALAWIAQKVNWALMPVIHRQYLSEKRAYTFAHEAAEGLRELRSKPHSMLLPAGLALINKTWLIMILVLVFLAFKVPISIGTIIAGFSIGYLFMIVSPTPAGIGIVEGGLTIALSSMYIAIEEAAVITLAYRAITFWLPLLFGLVSFRILEHIGGINAQARNGS